MTEWEAKIFGMDITFPIGYNCMIRLSDTDMLLAVNQMLQEISSKDVDIIITGSQAGLIPVDWSNTKYITNRHQVYFQGISPDIIVLCINPYDNINFIKKTIHVAEGMSNGKVIGIVCYPLDVDSSWRGAYGSKIHISDIKITMLKKRIYEEFGINMYLLDRLEELDSLLQSIIDYLGK